MSEGSSHSGGVKGTVLVVESDDALRGLLRQDLQRAGHDVLTTGLAADGLALLEHGQVGLVVLDLRLGDLDGDEALASILTTGVAVVAIAPRPGLEHRVHALERGADDVLSKPFSRRELVLRVEAVLRRASPPETPSRGPVSYGAGRLVIDEARHEVRVDGELVPLTPTEWGVLTALAATPGRVMTRYGLVNQVRGYEFSGYERTVDSHVKNLRHKLHERAGTQDHLVETVLGAGYRLAVSRDS